jgi:mRNA interferase MazF
MDEIKLGQVWLCNLNPTKGHEQSGIRPVIVVSNRRINKTKSELIIIMPVSSKEKYKKLPTCIKVELEKESYILTDQVRTISRTRLIKLLTKVETSKLEEVEKVFRSITF